MLGWDSDGFIKVFNGTTDASTLTNRKSYKDTPNESTGGALLIYLQ